MEEDSTQKNREDDVIRRESVHTMEDSTQLQSPQAQRQNAPVTEETKRGFFGTLGRAGEAFVDSKNAPVFSFMQALFNTEGYQDRKKAREVQRAALDSKIRDIEALDNDDVRQAGVRQIIAQADTAENNAIRSKRQLEDMEFQRQELLAAKADNEYKDTADRDIVNSTLFVKGFLENNKTYADCSSETQKRIGESAECNNLRRFEYFYSRVPLAIEEIQKSGGRIDGRITTELRRIAEANGTPIVFDKGDEYPSLLIEGENGEKVKVPLTPDITDEHGQIVEGSISKIRNQMRKSLNDRIAKEARYDLKHNSGFVEGENLKYESKFLTSPDGKYRMTLDQVDGVMKQFEGSTQISDNDKSLFRIGNTVGQLRDEFGDGFYNKPTNTLPPRVQSLLSEIQSRLKAIDPSIDFFTGEDGKPCMSDPNHSVMPWDKTKGNGGDTVYSLDDVAKYLTSEELPARSFIHRNLDNMLMQQEAANLRKTIGVSGKAGVEPVEKSPEEKEQEKIEKQIGTLRFLQAPGAKNLNALPQKDIDSLVPLPNYSSGILKQLGLESEGDFAKAVNYDKLLEYASSQTATYHSNTDKKIWGDIRYSGQDILSLVNKDIDEHILAGRSKVDLVEAQKEYDEALKKYKASPDSKPKNMGDIISQNTRPDKRKKDLHVAAAQGKLKVEEQKFYKVTEAERKAWCKAHPEYIFMFNEE